MAANYKVKLDTSVLDRMIAKVPQNAERLIAETALSVAEETRKNIMGWPLYDTGALHDGIKADKESANLWIVHDSVTYGVFWELGHKNIFMHRYVRKPFMTPAINYVAARFEQRIAQGIIK